MQVNKNQQWVRHQDWESIQPYPGISGLTADMSYPGGSSMLISSTLPQTVGTKVKERSLNEPALFLSVQQPRPGFNSKGEPPPKKTHRAMHLAVILWKIWGNRMKHKFLNLELGDSMHEKSNLRNPNLCWSFRGAHLDLTPLASTGFHIGNPVASHPSTRASAL